MNGFEWFCLVVFLIYLLIVGWFLVSGCGGDDPPGEM